MSGIILLKKRLAIYRQDIRLSGRQRNGLRGIDVIRISYDRASLNDLINGCASRSPSHYNAAWRVFISRYKKYVYAIVYKRCIMWEHCTRHDGFEFVDDMVNEIFYVLFRNRAKALRSFKARQSELAFRSYLATISDRHTARLLKQYISDTKAEEIQKVERAPNQGSPWQIFEHIVNRLRTLAGRNQNNCERDILIFNLYVLEGYTREMLHLQPIFNHLGHRVVDNVVMRCKQKLADEHILFQKMDPWL